MMKRSRNLALAISELIFRPLTRWCLRSRPLPQPAIMAAIERMQALYDSDDDSLTPSEFIANLWSDFRHWCDALGLDIVYIEQRAARTHFEEVLLRAPATDTGAQNAPRLHVPLSAWRDISGERDFSRLLSTVTVYGVSHHLEAIQVRRQGAVQVAVSLGAEIDLEAYHAAAGGRGPFATAAIGGRHYVLIMIPHSRG